MDLLSTIKGSLLERFFPEGWDLKKIDRCCSNPPEDIIQRQKWWNDDFKPVSCETIEEFNIKMGHEIALEILNTYKQQRKLILILPVGPMGMYKWTVYFLKEWNITCRHVYGFNMDEWSDIEGNTLPASNPGAFQNAMESAFYGPLENLTIPENQRNFATKKSLPLYPEKISELKKKDAKIVLVFGIGRVFHIAFWEPHFAAEFKDVEEWKKQQYRIGAKLHPLTIEQNAITSFKSRTTLVPCFANTIGPGIFLMADRIIGGCDGSLGRGMMWQGMSLWVTLRYSPDIWVPSSFMPTLPGRLFFLKELAGPLIAECN
ncbi:MAG: Glucosamine-6-phosphate deaminase [candidate division TA06 bacterium ADurb.Bin131]|jgi:glucosamine-6-phosphate deaminase|uniref:Glucosamine-6-phosphate deaminase n=1 Tax=candidate division TA06 bacterium ADurb.Bin131 TaxID=1852827 RepID=A0A1V6C3V9_UNCT6|nr:MAG: Glucosamine-6-phosphate deaminase [candidate division TA06 bacterium ADurb.Bin131]